MNKGLWKHNDVVLCHNMRRAFPIVRVCLIDLENEGQGFKIIKDTHGGLMGPFLQSECYKKVFNLDSATEEQLAFLKALDTPDEESLRYIVECLLQNIKV